MSMMYVCDETDMEREESETGGQKTGLWNKSFPLRRDV